MGFFKYPYSSYEKINLDWVLRKIKQLEPAIPLVEQSAAIVEDVQETAQEAAAAAASAQQAVATVTTLAQQANATSEEAKEIAQQAASATIADGSVGWAKLGTDVQQVIEGNVSRSTTASTNAALAQQTATNAQTAANNAASTADTAQSTANAAQTTANNALALASATWQIVGTLTSSGDTVYIPATAKEVLFEAFNIGVTPRIVDSKLIETTFFDVNNAINFNLAAGELYCIIETSRRVVFDPNGTFTGSALLRVCYK